MPLKYIKKNSSPSLLILFLCIFPGCSYFEYKEKNIEVKSINEELGLASINSPDFIRFLGDKGYSNQELPIKNWGLNELLLAQQFYSRKIATAKSEWEIIKGNEGLATLKPTTSVGIAIGKTDSNEEISKKTANWDPDRIANIDYVILNLAISEFLNFPTIPVKVTINEYIELSKEYSTPKSNVFVNGILDAIVKDYSKNSLIIKEGRGLVE